MLLVRLSIWENDPLFKAVLVVGWPELQEGGPEGFLLFVEGRKSIEEIEAFVLISTLKELLFEVCADGGVLVGGGNHSMKIYF